MNRRHFLSTCAAAAIAAPAQEPSSDPHFPKYHWRPAKNWMNDPNGLIYWNGEYHMFYQYNPNAAYWGDMHWGHAVSTDLMNWRQLPIALYPDKPYDKDGVFSGCAVVNDGVPTLVYTGTKPETQCIATTSDNLRKFQKSNRNPVIAAPPEGVKVTGFRDPCLWQENGQWMMALGSGFPDVGGAVLLYTSKDLLNWKYLHPLVQGVKENTGFNWECPNFFPLGNRHVLLISAEPFGNVLYFIGRYADRKFTPESEGVFDAGGSYYAPQTFLDDQNRRVIIGWLKETRSKEEQVKAGWSGVQSLPWVLSLRGDGTLGIAPHPNALRLRSTTKRLASISALDFAGPIEIDFAGQKLPISHDGETLRAGDRTAALKLPAGEKLQGQVFIDGSVVEVFANGRVGMSIRVYPSSPDVSVKGTGYKAYSMPATIRLS